TVTLQAGQLLGFYMAQNTSASHVLSLNSSNKGHKRTPVAFFSFTDANPDGIVHELANIDAANGRGVYAWEDGLNGGDLDYNDRVIAVRLSSDPAPPAEAFRVPAGPGRTVTASFQLQSALKSLMFGSKASSTTAPGEIGFFLVDGPDGRIGNL